MYAIRPSQPLLTRWAAGLRLLMIMLSVYRREVADGAFDVVPVRYLCITALGLCVVVSVSTTRGIRRIFHRVGHGSVSVFARPVRELQCSVDVQTCLPRLQFRDDPSQAGHAGCHDAGEDHDLVQERGDYVVPCLVSVGRACGGEEWAEGRQLSDNDANNAKIKNRGEYDKCQKGHAPGEANSPDPRGEEENDKDLFLCL